MATVHYPSPPDCPDHWHLCTLAQAIQGLEAYPWVLAPAFDESRALEERQNTLQEFFFAAWCCLDMGLGRQLRKSFPNRTDVYFGTPLGRFLTVLFTRLVVTSTPVELQFSNLTRLTDNRSKRLGHQKKR